MKSFTINSKVIYIIIALIFVVYCYFSYKVFIASTSKALIEGDATDSSGNITDLSTLKNYFINIGWLSVLNPVLIVLLIILVFFDSS